MRRHKYKDDNFLFYPLSSTAAPSNRAECTTKLHKQSFNFYFQKYRQYSQSTHCQDCIQVLFQQSLPFTIALQFCMIDERHEKSGVKNFSEYEPSTDRHSIYQWIVYHREQSVNSLWQTFCNLLLNSNSHSLIPNPVTAATYVVCIDDRHS